MRSFHTPTQKNHTQFHPKFPHFSPFSPNPQFLLILQRKSHLTKKSPLIEPLIVKSLISQHFFRPLSHKNQLKLFTNSLFHPNFLPYLKAFLRCTIFTSKITIQLIFFKHEIFKPSTENNNISHKIKK